MDYEAILNNEKIPENVRYAMLRSVIVEKAKNREERRLLLIQVGQHLNGKLIKGTPNYWVFPGDRKAKFQ